MEENLNGMFKMFGKAIIVFIVVFLVTFIFLTAFYSDYNQNLFEIKVNEKKMNAYYTEKYRNGLIINASKEGYNDVEPRINDIGLENITLDVSEYEVYYKNNMRKRNTNNWHKESDLIYKKINNNVTRLVIKRMDKVLYDGPYIKDVSKYINEKGRYYLHIYLKRKDNLISSVTTHISFNVIAGGGNYDINYDLTNNSDENNYDYTEIVNEAYKIKPELFKFNSDDIAMIKMDLLMEEITNGKETIGLGEVPLTKEQDQCVGYIVVTRNKDNTLKVDSSHVCDMIDY